MNEVNEINILLTSAGRRGYLVKYFKSALKGKGRVHVGNSDSVSPAFYYADQSVVTPLIYEENYISFLINYCKKNNIKIIISLFDIDLMILAQNKKIFQENDINVLVSDENVIDICNDKWNTYKFCIKNNIECPKTYIEHDKLISALEKDEIDYPIIIKPRWGMGSISIYEAHNYEQLKVFSEIAKDKIQNTYLKYESEADLDKCLVYQEKIVGQEYGMDVINDLQGNYCTTVVRKKIAMRSGETDAAIVLEDSRLQQFGQKLGHTLSHIANLDADVFVSNEKIYLLEMNARFGGGYPFSHQAGVDLPEAIIKWTEGKELSNELNVKEYNRIIHKDIQIIRL